MHIRDKAAPHMAEGRTAVKLRLAGNQGVQGL